VKRPAALLLVSALAACGGGGDKVEDHGTVTATGAASAQTATVGMTDELIFTPNVVRAKVGTLTITADNLGRIPHDLVFEQQGLGQTDRIDGKEKGDVTVVFKKAGTFTFVCTLHPGMTGKAVVS
jgi:plastocyanin